jgi:hypothetical protein
MDPQEKEMESFRKEDLGDRPSDWDGERGYKPIGGLRARHLYDTDLEDYHQGQRGRRRHFAQDELLSEDWLFVVDNDLPLTLSKNTSLWEDLRQLPTVTKLCSECASFRILSQPPSSNVQSLTVDIGKLREVATSCDLCKFFLQCLDCYKFGSDETIEVLRDCSVLKVDKHSQPFLVILGDPGKSHP